MKILIGEQIAAVEQRALSLHSISSLELMENAAKAAALYLTKKFSLKTTFYVFCGRGNNGGDGLALARILNQKMYTIIVFLDLQNLNFSESAIVNYQRLKDISSITILDFSEFHAQRVCKDDCIIDALFGIGLNREITGNLCATIKNINDVNCHKISLDIPSGLFADKWTPEEFIVFQADETLSFHFWKKSFLYPETGKYCGTIEILDIGIPPDAYSEEMSDHILIDQFLVENIYRPRVQFSHKGTYGKTAIIAGSYGKIGAAVLATKAALRTGSGLTFCIAPECGYNILQAVAPEAMFIKSGDDNTEQILLPEEVTCGIGPGLGTDKPTIEAFIQFFTNYKKALVIDADALNIISENSQLLSVIPTKSILTPHPKEFERLFGITANSYERTALAQKKASELDIFIVLKGHHTQIFTPYQKIYYNITGNSGMAKGGSGDALTGIITSLLAQGYSSENASVFGVWLHGSAGDLAAEKSSKEALLASDLIENIGNVFLSLNS